MVCLLGRGLFRLPPSRDMTPQTANRQGAEAETRRAQFQSLLEGVVYAGKARLLAGLRTSHSQLYVS